MKTRKRLLAIILAVVLVLGMTTPGFAAYGGIENGELRVENEEQLPNLGCDNGTYSEDAATPNDLLITETQATSPAALSPAYIGITPLNTTINVADLITAGVNAGSVAEGWVFFAANNLINIQNANHLTFTGGTPGNMLDVEITINGNVTPTANITIENLHLNRVSTGNPLAVVQGASLNLTISATNTLQSGGVGGAGILTSGANTTLTIDGTGSLTARGHGFSAGIGGGGGGNAGNITILPTFNGTINAYGGANGAGIGGGSGGSGGNVTIGGGVINATGGGSAPAIGAGSGNNNHGTLNVTGGNVTQTVMNSTQLTQALAAIGNGTGTIRLGASFTHNQLITIPTGANITLTSDSTVRTLTRGVATGHFIRTNGSLALDNITIDGANAVTAGTLVFVPGGGTLVMYDGAAVQNDNASASGSMSGVWVDVGGMFTMYGGTISGNTVTGTSSATGVSVGGTFVMYGGTISGNTAAAGISVSAVSVGGTGTFTMHGGTIIGNNAFGNSSSVRIALSGTFNLGGNAVINGNTGGNLLLVNGAFITLATGADAPTVGMDVSVQTGTSGGVIVQSGATAAHAAFFSAGAAGMAVVHDTGQLRIAAATFALTVNGSHATIPIPSSGAGNFPPFAQDATARDIRATDSVTQFWRMPTLNNYVWFNGWTIAGGAVANPNLPVTSIQMPSNNVTATANWIPAFHVDIGVASGLTFSGAFENITSGGNASLGNLSGNGQQSSGTPPTGGQRWITPSSFSATIATAFVPSGSVPVWSVNGVVVTDARVSNNGFTFTESNVTSNLTIEVDIATPTPITTAAITGMQTPTTGQTRIGTGATGIGNFNTSAVTWASTGTLGTNFRPSTTYTASITLTAHPGHTFPAGFTGTINGNPATVVNTSPGTDANQVTLTLEFPVTAAQGGGGSGGSGDHGTWRPPTTALPQGEVPFAGYGESEVALPYFPFIDVATTHWFYPYVRTVWENELFQGTSHNMFTPHGNMTRAMFVQVFANMDGADLTAYQANSPRFADTSPAAWYFGAVDRAAEQGLAHGIGSGNFEPGRAITREEMAVMLYNYAVSRNIIFPQSTTTAFADQAAISDWAVDAVSAIQEAGIIVGRPDGSFAPRATATRAEVATIFARFLEVTEN